MLDMKNKLTIVGIGPGDRRFLTMEALEAMQTADHVYFRTHKHPVVAYIQDLGVESSSFDDVYEGQKVLMMYILLLSIKSWTC